MYFTNDGRKLWNFIQKRKLEGVISKYLESKYYSNKRSFDWLKIKSFKTIDAVILGYTKEKRIISSLVLGLYKNKNWQYIGKVPVGFAEEFLEKLLKEFKEIKPLTIEAGSVKINWIKPELVCEVKYLEISQQGILRAPSFIKIRIDKLAKDCTYEQIRY